MTGADDSRYSRMLLGFFITFEPPSLYSVLATLKRVNRHKAYVQKLYPQIKRPWDGWGCPTEILVCTENLIRVDNVMGSPKLAE